MGARAIAMADGMVNALLNEVSALMSGMVDAMPLVNAKVSGWVNESCLGGCICMAGNTWGRVSHPPAA
jgi:hypothetical protein